MFSYSQRSSTHSVLQYRCVPFAGDRAIIRIPRPPGWGQYHLPGSWFWNPYPGARNNLIKGYRTQQLHWSLYLDWIIATWQWSGLLTLPVRSVSWWSFHCHVFPVVKGWDIYNRSGQSWFIRRKVFVTAVSSSFLSGVSFISSSSDRCSSGNRFFLYRKVLPGSASGSTPRSSCVQRSLTISFSKWVAFSIFSTVLPVFLSPPVSVPVPGFVLFSPRGMNNYTVCSGQGCCLTAVSLLAEKFLQKLKLRQQLAFFCTFFPVPALFFLLRPVKRKIELPDKVTAWRVIK